MPGTYPGVLSMKHAYEYCYTPRRDASTKITPTEKNVQKHRCNGNVNTDVHAR